jgi:hypothetical protein
MARLKKDPLLIRTHALTPETSETLHRLSQDGSDRLGWTVSGSAVVRALLRHGETQPPAWAVQTLFPLISEEIAQGRVWGSKRGKR